jgi:hypothetical protein
MRSINRKHIKSKYKCVIGYESKNTGIIRWYVTIKGISQTPFKTEKEAAIAADKCMINKGKTPVNILTPKTNTP